MGFFYNEIIFSFIVRYILRMLISLFMLFNLFLTYLFHLDIIYFIYNEDIFAKDFFLFD